MSDFPVGVKTSNVALSAAITELLGNYFDGENFITVRVAINNLIAQIVASDLYQQAGIGQDTYADLLATGITSEGSIGYVFADPDPTKNGTYVYLSGAWGKTRSFPDTATTLAISGGSANALTVTYATGVDPSIIVIGLLTPTAPNSGPVTINGEPLYNAYGTALSGGELIANRTVMLRRVTGAWRLLTPAPFVVPHRGEYNALSQYYAGEAASLSGTSYFAVADSLGVTPGTDTSKWVVWAARGPTGPGTGDLLASNNLSDVASALAAFDTIKQLATDAYAGVVGLATDAEVAAGVATDLAVTPAGLQAKVATVAEFRAKTAGTLVAPDVVKDAAAFVTIADAATLTPDLNAGWNFDTTPMAARVFGTPSNADINQEFFIRVTAGVAGAMAHTFHANYKFPSGVAPTFTTGLGKVDLLFCKVLAANFIYCSVVNDVR